MKPWLSKAAVQLREQVDDSFPERIRKSDGWIGDARHSTRKSDHDPDTNGCVRAIDIDARLSDDKGLSAYLADQIRSYGKTKWSHQLCNPPVKNCFTDTWAALAQI